MKHLFVNFTGKDWGLWIGSLIIVAGANLVSRDFDAMILCAALIGVTSLIFAAKGNVLSQVLMVVFSILYGIISFRFRYWGEMITYLGMTLPMAVWSFFTWFRNSSEERGGEVIIASMTVKKWGILIGATVVVTTLFYFVLKAFDTPNLAFSTLSVTTSFLAAALTMLRSKYYALFYAANDVVLVVLWILASLSNPVYVPVIVIFLIFLVNDSYGFISWKKREKEAS